MVVGTNPTHVGLGRVQHDAHGVCCNSQVVFLDVVLQEGESLSLLTVVLDGDGGSTSDLSGVTLGIVLAETEPLTEVVTGLHLDEGDVVGLGQSGNELLVLGIIAVLGKDAEHGLLFVKALADFVESFNQTYRLN